MYNLLPPVIHSLIYSPQFFLLFFHSVLLVTNFISLLSYFSVAPYGLNHYMDTIQKFPNKQKGFNLSFRKCVRLAQQLISQTGHYKSGDPDPTWDELIWAVISRYRRRQLIAASQGIYWWWVSPAFVRLIQLLWYQQSREGVYQNSRCRVVLLDETRVICQFAPSRSVHFASTISLLFHMKHANPPKVEKSKPSLHILLLFV